MREVFIVLDVHTEQQLGALKHEEERVEHLLRVLIYETRKLGEELMAEIDDQNTAITNLAASITALEAAEAAEASAPPAINNDPALLAQIATNATEIAALQARIDALTTPAAP